jgi:hypothetical protein
MLDALGTPHTPTEDDFRFFDNAARQAADLIERTLADGPYAAAKERFRLIANTAPVMIRMSGTDNETYLNQTGSITRTAIGCSGGQATLESSTQTKRSDAARCKEGLRAA